MKRTLWIALYVIIAIAFTIGEFARAEDVSETSMLLSSSDDTLESWTLTGCITDSFDCINDNPPHDADNTYLGANPLTPGSVISNFQIGNLPNGVLSIQSVMAFVWVRLDVGTASGFGFRLQSPTTDCALVTPSPVTTLYQNWTFAYVQNCDAVAWTVDSVNAARFQIECTDDGIGPAEENCRVTSIGIVVAYTVIGGSVTETEWSVIILLIVAVTFIIAGFAIQNGFLLLIGGMALTFLSFEAFSASGSEAGLVIFLLMGIVFMLISIFMFFGGEQ